MNQKLNRRDFLRLTGVGAAASVLAACATATPSPPSGETEETPSMGPTTINYWHIWGGVRTEQLQTVFDTFMEENPDIIVDPLLLPNPGYQDKIITGLAGDAVDLTMIYTDEFAPSAKRGALKSVDEMMAADGLSSDIWYPGIWDMTLWDGKAYGLPFVGNFLAMIYWNKDDFEAGGFDPETGAETWAELSNIAESLTTFDANGNIENLGFVPTISWPNAAYRNGVSLLGDGNPENIALDDPRSIESLVWLKELYDVQGGWDAVGGATDAWGNQQLGNPMIAGVASSILSGVFTVNIINDQAPDLNYKIGLVPHGPNGESLDLIVASWDNVIPVRSKHPEQAWELAKYLSAGEGHLKFMVEIQGRPAMVKKYNVAPYDAAAREKNPYWDIVLEILNGKQASLPVSDKLGQFNNLITEAYESMMLEQRTPEEAATWAQEQVVKVFSEED